MVRTEEIEDVRDLRDLRGNDVMWTIGLRFPSTLYLRDSRTSTLHPRHVRLVNSAHPWRKFLFQSPKRPIIQCPGCPTGLGHTTAQSGAGRVLGPDSHGCAYGSSNVISGRPFILGNHTSSGYSRCSSNWTSPLPFWKSTSTGLISHVCRGVSRRLWGS